MSYSKNSKRKRVETTREIEKNENEDASKVKNIIQRREGESWGTLRPPKVPMDTQGDYRRSWGTLLCDFLKLRTI